MHCYMLWFGLHALCIVIGVQTENDTTSQPSSWVSWRSLESGLRHTCPQCIPSQQRHFFKQRVDHFDPSNAQTFRQAYFVDTRFWSGPQTDAPVFLSIGGEAPQKPPGDDFITDWLPSCKGLLFTVEHRYYGCHDPSSCPYNVSNPGQNYLEFLSTKQALSDLASFQRFASESYGLGAGARWILIGGSYPGILAAMGRAEFPSLFFAAVASSAPVQAVVDFRGFEDVVSNAYALPAEGVNGTEACRDTIIEAHKAVGALLATSAGRHDLAQLFELDPAVLETASGRRDFAGCGVAHFPAQTNDPLCDKAGCGVAQICQVMLDASSGESPLERLRTLRKLQGVKSRTREFDLGEVMQNCEMDTLWEAADYIPMESLYWAYQTCNEYGFYQTCEEGSRCLYVRGLVSFQVSGAHRPDHFCETRFGISPEETAHRVLHGNNDRMAKLASASRILWVNGDVDPWHSQSVIGSAPGPDQPVVFPVSGASHCAWMRAAKAGEQPSLSRARRRIYEQLTDWLDADARLWASRTDAPPTLDGVSEWCLFSFMCVVVVGAIARAKHGLRQGDLAEPLVA